MTTIARRITGGVDTHLDVHVAAAFDDRGALLGVESFPTTPDGYRELLAWLEASARSSSSGSRAPAATAPDSPATSTARASGSSRSTGPTVSDAGARASPIPKTPIAAARAAQGGDADGSPRPGTATSSRCGCCGLQDLGTEGPDPGDQPDAQPHLDRTRLHPVRAA